MMRWILLSTLILVGCEGTRVCKQGTVFVTIAFEGAAADADSLDVALSLDGGAVQRVPKAHVPGQSRGTLQVNFARAYPASSAFTIMIVATRSGAEIGQGSATEKLKPGCHALSLIVHDASASSDAALDLTSESDLPGIDLRETDLEDDAGMRDMARITCAGSSSCPSPAPICDSATMECRGCAGSADDLQCAARDPQTPRCKLSGPRAAQCAVCNTDGECTTATPICASDGVCRKCRAHTECPSGVCDLTGKPTDGTCVPTGNVVYVAKDTCPGSGADGSQAKPFCEITTAVANLASRIYIHVAGSDSYYQAGVTIQPPSGAGTSTEVRIIGPGRTATKRAVVRNVASTAPAFVISAQNQNQSAFVELDGFEMWGRPGFTSDAVRCDDAAQSNANLILVVRNSIVQSATYGIHALQCRIIAYSNIVTKTDYALKLEGNSTYVISNNFIYYNGSAIQFGTADGFFGLNTLAFNGQATGYSVVDCGGTLRLLEASIIVQNDKISGSQFSNSGNCRLANVVTGTDSISDTGKLLGTPVFANETGPNYDLHLRTDDPASLAANLECCIDKVVVGDAGADNLSDDDIDGETRPKGLGKDVGADEAR